MLDIRVSEVVKPDVLRTDGLQDLLMGVPEGIRVEYGAGLGRHKQVGTVWVLCVFLHQQLHRPLRDSQLIIQRGDEMDERASQASRGTAS